MLDVTRTAKSILLLCGLCALLACAAEGSDDAPSEVDEDPVAAPIDGTRDAGSKSPDAARATDAARSGDAAGRSDAARAADGSRGDAASSARDGQASSSDARAPEEGDVEDAATPEDAAAPVDTDEGDATVPSEDDPCEPGEAMLSGQTSGGRGDGFVEMQVQPPNEYTRMRTKMTVGAEPPKVGTVFVWPGFQPLRASRNYSPIVNGVLQPVLGWGPACAPGGLRDYSSWWISAMYVNVTTREPGYNGCYGSKILRVEPRDVLEIDIVLKGTDWVQYVRNQRTGESIEYSIDLKGQQQNRALFWIELPNGSAKPVEDAVFDEIVLTTKMPDPRACSAIARGTRDFVAKPRLSKDGLHCCVDRLTLRASGVTATTSPLKAYLLGLPSSAVTEEGEYESLGTD